MREKIVMNTNYITISFNQIDMFLKTTMIIRVL